MAVHWRWFLTLDIFTWGDWGWYFPETVRTWWDFPRIWFAGPFGGLDFSIFQYVPSRLLYGFLATFSNFEVFDRIVFIFPSVLLPVVGAFFLVRHVTKSNVAGALGSLIFSLNSYAAITRTGHFTLASSFSLAPLILFFVIKSLETRRVINAIWAGIASVVAFAYEPRAFLLTWGICMLYGIYYLCILKTSLIKKLQLVLVLVVPLVMVLLLHFYSFIGLYFASSQISSQITSRSLFGSGYVSVNRAMALAVSSWNEVPGKALQIIPPYFWITALTAIAGMWYGRKNKVVIFFAFITLIGIFLNKHINQPFGTVYVWLYKYLPGFNAFREPSKFYFFIALGYAVLSGWYIKWGLAVKNKLLRVLVVAVAFLPFIINGFVISKGHVGKLMTPRHLPSQYITLKSFLTANSGEYRVLYVPAETRWGYWDEHIRKLSAVNLVLWHWPDLNTYSLEGKDYSYLEHTMSLLEKPEADYLLDISAMRYIVVPSEDMANEDVFTFAWGAREEFLARVENLPYLKRVDIGETNLDVFENVNWKPLIYLSSGREQLQTPQSTVPVEFKQIKPFQYELFFNERTWPAADQVLNFTDLFNRGWRLYAGKVSWWQVFLGIKAIPLQAHTESIIHTNEFKIAPDYKNTEQIVTLYFQPQSYIFIGVGVSLIAAGILGAGLIFYGIHKKRN